MYVWMMFQAMHGVHKHTENLSNVFLPFYL